MLPIALFKQASAQDGPAEAFLSEREDSDEEYTVFGRAAMKVTREGFIWLYLEDAYVFSSDTEGVFESPVPIGGVRCMLSSGAGISIGGTAALKGRLALAEEAENPGQFDMRAYLKREGADCLLFSAELVSFKKAEGPAALWYGILELLGNAREAAASKAAELFSEEAAGTLAAMITGERRYLSDEDKALFKMGGISHVLAISGLHVSLLGGALLKILQKLRMPEHAAGRTAFLLLLSYAVATGASVSTLRAALMFGLTLLGKRIGRTYDTLSALSLCALILVAADPLTVLDSGFQLSFTAVLAMALTRERGGAYAAAAVYLATLPIAVCSYHEVPTYGVIANLFLLPLMPLLLGSGILGLMSYCLLSPFNIPAAKAVLAFPADASVHIFMKALKGVSALPMALMSAAHPSWLRLALYLAAFSAFLWLGHRLKDSWKKYAVTLCAPMIAGIFLIVVPGELKAAFLSVGQGECIVLTRGSSAVIVDCGSSSADSVGKYRLLPYLEYMGIRRIEAVVATHGDLDHVNGLTELFEAKAERTISIGIDRLVIPKVEEPKEELREVAALAVKAGIRVSETAAGDAFSWLGAEFSVLAPFGNESPAADGNEASVVLLVSFGSFDCLLTGDLEGEAEEGAARLLAAGDFDIELLKAAHHGSKNSSSAAFLAAAGPECAVISCGKDNRYGHPHAETLQRLAEIGAVVFRTDTGGCIEVSARQDGGFSVKAFNADDTWKFG